MKASKAARYGAIGTFVFLTAKGLVWLAILGWGIWTAT